MEGGKMAIIIIIQFCFLTKVTVLVGGKDHFIQKWLFDVMIITIMFFAVSGERVHIDGPDTGQIGATLELSCST